MTPDTNNGKTIHDKALADIQNANAKTVIDALTSDELKDLIAWCHQNDGGNSTTSSNDPVCQAAYNKLKTPTKAKAAAANGGTNTIKLRNADVGMTPEEGDEGPQFS